jgi:hypothetical protein
MEILLIAIVGALNITCFFIGAKVGQSVAKGEKIEIPSVDPMKPIREHRARKEAEMAQDRIDTIMRNIENYDGTAKGQEDVPRG